MRIFQFFIFGVLLCGIAVSESVAKSAHPDASSKNVITLQQAYDRTLATDQSIRIAYQELKKANLLPWSALTRLGPRMNANASLGHSENSTHTSVLNTNDLNGARRPGVIFSQTNSTGVGISVLQPLIDFTVFPAYTLGKLSRKSTHLAYQYTIRETLFGVASAYYEVLKQQEVVAVNQSGLDLADQQLDLAQKRANAGEVTRSDVLRARVIVETARQTLISSQNMLLLDKNTMANILNLKEGEKFEVTDPPKYPTKLPPFEALLLNAYSHREDLQVARIAVSQDRERRNVVVGEYGPTVSAQLNTNYNNASGTGNSSRNNSWNAGISVQMPIFTGGQRTIDLITANHQIRETKYEAVQKKKTVQQEVKQAWLAVRTLEETLKAARIQLQSADQGYKDLVNQYKAGTATSVDVLTSLNDLNTARTNLAVQRYAYQVALRNLDEVKGTFQEKRVLNARE